MQVRVGCRFDHRYAYPVPTVWQVRPRDDAHHRLISEAWRYENCQPAGSYLDLYGNICHRMTLGEGDSMVEYDALVEVPASFDAADPHAAQLPVEQLPDHTLGYLLPSRFCLSDQLSDTAWDLFGSTPLGWSRVQAVCDWVHGHVAFQYGASVATTTALDVFERRQGVCRDFAHLAVAFCRALNIPARYVCGYLPDIAVPPPRAPMDFCAWFEAYLQDRWWTFDARNNVPRVGRTVIGRGRDAVDVAMVTAYGQLTLLGMEVWADQVTAPPD